MAWCHYLSQCWHSSMLPYGITRPQWFNNELLTVSCEYLEEHWKCFNRTQLHNTFPHNELLQSCFHIRKMKYEMLNLWHWFPQGSDQRRIKVPAYFTISMTAIKSASQSLLQFKLKSQDYMIIIKLFVCTHWQSCAENFSFQHSLPRGTHNVWHPAPIESVLTKWIWMMQFSFKGYFFRKFSYMRSFSV